MQCIIRGQLELKVITCKGHKNASNQVTFDYYYFM